MKQPKVLVIGLVGFNLGDEAIALKVAEAIGVRYRVTIVSLNQGAILRYGLREFYFKPRSIVSWLSLLLEVLSSRKVIVGGGSLIQDKMGGGGMHGVIGYLNLVTMMLKLSGKKIISIPLGVDSLSEKNVRLANNIISRFERLVVRDELSKQNVTKYTHGRLVPEVVPDPVFGFPADHSLIRDSGSYYLDGIPESNYVCLALAKENVVNEGGVLIGQLIQCIVAWVKEGRKVLLVCMDARENDEFSLYEYIEREVDKSFNGKMDGRVRIYIPSDIYSAARCLRYADAIVAMRLHAMIMAYSYSKIYCISRTTKTKAICDDLRIPYIDLEVTSQFDEEALLRVKKLNFSFDRSAQLEQLGLRVKAINEYLGNI